MVAILGALALILLTGTGCERDEPPSVDRSRELRRLFEALPQVAVADVYLGGIGSAGPYSRLYVPPGISAPDMRALPGEVASVIHQFDATYTTYPSSLRPVDIRLVGSRFDRPSSVFTFDPAETDLKIASGAAESWARALSEHPPGMVSIEVPDKEAATASLLYTGELAGALTWLQQSSLKGFAFTVSSAEGARPQVSLSDESPLTRETATRWIAYEKATKRPRTGVDISRVAVAERPHGRSVTLDLRLSGASEAPAEATYGPLVWPLVDTFRTEPPVADSDGLREFDLQLGHAVAPRVNTFADLLSDGLSSPRLPDWKNAYAERHSRFIDPQE